MNTRSAVGTGGGSAVLSRSSRAVTVNLVEISVSGLGGSVLPNQTLDLIVEGQGNSASVGGWYEISDERGGWGRLRRWGRLVVRWARCKITSTTADLHHLDRGLHVVAVRVVH